MMTITALDELRVELQNQMVLSVYITGGEHSPAERSSWRKRLEQQLDMVAAASGVDADFNRARRLIEAELGRHSGFLPGPGWVAFATGERLWSCEQVPAPVPSLVRWRRGITLAPYLRVLKQTRPVVLALVDSKRARLFRYVAGSALEPVDTRADTFIDDLTDRNMAKRATTHSGVRGETATDAADRVLHSERERMLKQVAADVLALAGRDGLVVLGGPTVAVSALQQQLAKQLGYRLAVDESAHVRMSGAAAEGVIERCATRLSHRLQRIAVAGILATGGSMGHGALGLHDTTAAVAGGQVETLLLTPSFIFNHEADAEDLIARVLELGGSAEEVADRAAELLDEHGEGLAARLRFATRVDVVTEPVTSVVQGDADIARDAAVIRCSTLTPAT